MQILLHHTIKSFFNDNPHFVKNYTPRFCSQKKTTLLSNPLIKRMGAMAPLITPPLQIQHQAFECRIFEDYGTLEPCMHLTKHDCEIYSFKDQFWSSTCALRCFFWLVSHVIYFKLTRELQECLLSQASIFEW